MPYKRPVCHGFSIYHKAPNCFRYFSELAFVLAGGFNANDFLKLMIAFFVAFQRIGFPEAIPCVRTFRKSFCIQCKNINCFILFAIIQQLVAIDIQFVFVCKRDR